MGCHLVLSLQCFEAHQHGLKDSRALRLNRVRKRAKSFGTAFAPPFPYVSMLRPESRCHQRFRNADGRRECSFGPRRGV